MFQQTIHPEPPPPPRKLVLQNYQREGLLILVLGLLYVRLTLRRRKKFRTCSQCNHDNPPHRTNCSSCHAPLLVMSRNRADRVEGAK